MDASRLLLKHYCIAKKISIFTELLEIISKQTTDFFATGSTPLPVKDYIYSSLANILYYQGKIIF